MSENEKKSFSDKFVSYLEEHLLPLSAKLAEQRYLAAIRDSFPALIPLTFVGGIAILLACPPIPETMTEATGFLSSFLLGWQAWADANASMLWTIFGATIGMTSIWIVLSLSYRLAMSYKMDPINNMFCALAIFLFVSDAFDFDAWTYNVDRFSATYMFGALLITMGVVEINHQFMAHDVKIKMPDAVPPNITAPFEILLPFIANLFIFEIINQVLHAITGAGILDLIFTIIQPLLHIGNTLPAILVILVLMELFWFFGIHGDNMVGVVVEPLATSNLMANMEAYAAGKPAPYILCGSTQTIFGQWLCFQALLILMLTVCKSEQLKGVAKVAVAPIIFNINEPTIFGVPYVLNVLLLIPKMICTLLNFTVYYTLASLHIVGRPVISLPWTTPVPVMIGVGTMDFKTVILWLVMLFVDMAICYPFMKSYDKTLVEQEIANAGAEA